jgi:hypothetical protein
MCRFNARAHVAMSDLGWWGIGSMLGAAAIAPSLGTGSGLEPKATCWLNQDSPDPEGPQ